MPLTDRQIKLIKPTSKEQVFGDGAGLYLRVYPSGNKDWRYRYMIKNNSYWYFLGMYPSLSLAEARLKAHELKALVRRGENPIEKKNEEQQAKANEEAKLKARITTEELFNRWMKFDISNRKDGGAEVSRSFEKDVLPEIGKIPAEDITKAHIAKILDTCLARGSDRMAKVILSLIRQMFRFAQDRDLIQTDPTATIRKNKIGKPDVERERVLSESEIKILAKIATQAGLNKPTQLAIWIQLATGCRIGELVKSKWADVDFKTKTWLITPENSKNGKPNTVHLSSFAISKFKSLKTFQPQSIWVFPNRENTGHLNTKTITKQIGDRQIGEERKLKNRTKQTTALLLKNGKWTPHDLRRTSATLMTALGVLPDVADRCLNHVEQNKIRRTYMQHSYTKEKIKAWNALGKRLDILTKLSEPINAKLQHKVIE